MIALARAAGTPMTITHVAEERDIPKKFLEQILLLLKADGLLTSKAGPHGGYALAAHLPASDITVGRILAAVEEPMSRRRGEPPIPPNPNHAMRTPSGVATMLEDIRNYVRRKLDTVSLEDLAAQDVPAEDMEALMWYI